MGTSLETRVRVGGIDVVERVYDSIEVHRRTIYTFATTEEARAFIVEMMQAISSLNDLEIDRKRARYKDLLAKKKTIEDELGTLKYC